MSAPDLALVAALIFAWGALSARLERSDATAPIIFTAAGLLLTHGPLAVLSISPSSETVRGLAETTLVLVLFADASRVDLRSLSTDWKLYARLLGAGLPLTIALGSLPEPPDAGTAATPEVPTRRLPAKPARPAKQGGPEHAR